MGKNHFRIMLTFILFVLVSCSSQNKMDSPIKVAKDGVIEYTIAEYINMLSLDKITAGMQRLKPTYRVTQESGYMKFSYNFELNNSSKIHESYGKYCYGRGGEYLSSDWTVAVCSKRDSVPDSLFFINLKPVSGFSSTFKYVNLWVLEPSETAAEEYEEFIRLSGYLSPEQIRYKQESQMEVRDGVRRYEYMRTIGSKVCKKQVSSIVFGIIERVDIDRIQIRTEDKHLMWVDPSDWKPC